MTSPNPADSGGSKWFIVAIAAVFVLGAAGIALAVSTSDGGESGISNVPSGRDIEATSPVEVDGDPLPAFPTSGLVLDAAVDPAIGSIAPTLTGTDFSGEDVTIGPDGNPKAVMFVAHWCPYCQVEIPRVVDLIEDGKLPEGLDVYALSTGVDSGAINFPPNNWLNREDWNELSMRDSDTNSAMSAYGGTGYPFVVYLDGDNNVVGRSSGELTAAQIEAAWGATVAASSVG